MDNVQMDVNNLRYRWKNEYITVRNMQPTLFNGMKFVATLMTFVGETFDKVHISSDIWYKMMYLNKSPFAKGEHGRFIKKYGIDYRDALVICKNEVFGKKHIDLILEYVDGLMKHPMKDCGVKFFLESASCLRKRYHPKTLEVSIDWCSTQRILAYEREERNPAVLKNCHGFW